MSARSIIADTTHSLHARLRPVAVGSVQLADVFWEPRRRINQSATLPSQYRMCEQTGRIDNFRRAAGKKGGPFRGRYYNDSDVYKWVEAASFALLVCDVFGPEGRPGMCVHPEIEMALVELYRDEPQPRAGERPIPFTAVPYCAWGNRGPGGMAVWLSSESTFP